MLHDYRATEMEMYLLSNLVMRPNYITRVVFYIIEEAKLFLNRCNVIIYCSYKYNITTQTFNNLVNSLI